VALRVPERRAGANLGGALFAPLVTLILFAVALAVLLALSPLWELPDTYCQTVLRPPKGDGCAQVTSRRWHWIVVVLFGAAVLTVVAVLARRRSTGAATAAPVQVGLLLCAFAVGLVGAAFLTIGRNHDQCGSTLSRIDPYGSYAPARPALCARSYAASRHDAWICAGVAGAALAAATALGVRRRENGPTGPPARPA
jgi:hypothetical protein